MIADRTLADELHRLTLDLAAVRRAHRDEIDADTSDEIDEAALHLARASESAWAVEP